MEEKSGNGGEMQASTSFTALLGLPSSSAMELLREMERNQHKLLERSSPISAPQKRKKAQHKGNASGKRTKNGDGGGEEEKLPYVHVRARRGQATDSHSLAERARREKINARMKLLQDLVPGCSKVSGTAQVLDEIINHVQSLQRQVEVRNPQPFFLSLSSFISFLGVAVLVDEASSSESLWNGVERDRQLSRSERRSVMDGATPQAGSLSGSAAKVVWEERRLLLWKP